METINLFPTQIFCIKCDFNLNYLYDEILNHSKNYPNETRSSNNGYQSKSFNDEYFNNKIKEYIPQRSDLKIKNFNIDTWANINYPGASNDPHEHLNTGGFLSGVLYVKVPKNSGNIVFHDPRHYMQIYSEPLLYYNNCNAISSYFPLENELLLFPYWLVHSVEENKSNENRISIAFNINYIQLS